MSDAKRNPPKERKDTGQIALFEKGESWQDDWKGMPEFVQKDLYPWKTLYVHFTCREDMDKFAQLVAQRIGVDTRFIWFPAAEIAHLATMRYSGTTSPGSPQPVVEDPHENDINEGQ